MIKLIHWFPINNRITRIIGFQLNFNVITRKMICLFIFSFSFLLTNISTMRPLAYYHHKKVSPGSLLNVYRCFITLDIPMIFIFPKQSLLYSSLNIGTEITLLKKTGVNSSIGIFRTYANHNRKVQFHLYWILRI